MSISNESTPLLTHVLASTLTLNTNNFKGSAIDGEALGRDESGSKCLQSQITEFLKNMQDQAGETYDNVPKEKRQLGIYYVDVRRIHECISYCK